MSLGFFGGGVIHSDAVFDAFVILHMEVISGHEVLLRLCTTSVGDDGTKVAKSFGVCQMPDTSQAAHSGSDSRGKPDTGYWAGF